MRPSPWDAIRANLKRNIFLATVSGSAIWWFHEYTLTRSLMKSACNRVVTLGDSPEDLNNRIRHVTVILNPVSGKHKAKKLFNTWAEPLLHLSGIKVSIVETTMPNEAYELMKVMSNCDAVAIVGGDGTVHEAINGLLQRPDRANAAKSYPIAIIPTGQYNSVARYVYQGRFIYRNQKQFIIQSTINLIKGKRENIDALKIKSLANPEQHPEYALRDVRFGHHQDNYVKLNGFKIYQNNIKPVWLKLKSFITMKYNRPQIVSLAYTKPCPGCSKCHDGQKLKNDSTVDDKSVSRRWWSILSPIPKRPQVPSGERQLETDMALNDNPECGRWIEIENSSPGMTDFRASMMGDRKIRLSIGHEGDVNLSEVMEAKDVRLHVSPELDEKRVSDQVEESMVSDSDLRPKDEIGEKARDDVVKFLIDRQPKQAHSVEISPISDAVRIFSSP